MLGSEANLAALIASTGFLVYAFWGVIGGVLFLLYPPRQEKSCADIEGAGARKSV